MRDPYITIIYISIISDEIRQKIYGTKYVPRWSKKRTKSKSNNKTDKRKQLNNEHLSHLEKCLLMLNEDTRK